MSKKEFKQASMPVLPPVDKTRQVIDDYLSNFRGQNKQMRSGSFGLSGGGNTPASFLSNAIAVTASYIPNANNAYTLGSSSNKWADLRTVLINGVVPRVGSLTVYVAATSGAAATTAITFNGGILT